MDGVYNFLKTIKDQEIVNRLTAVSRRILPHLDCSRIFHRFFTSHGILHSVNILRRILELEDLFQFGLTTDEMALLYISSFLHDVGMLPTYDDLEFITNNKQQPDRLKRRMWQVRMQHAWKKRIKEQLGDIEPDLTFLSVYSRRHVESILLNICSSHSSKSDTELAKLKLSERLSIGKDVRTMLLAAILRIADELDAGQDRSLPEKYYEYNILPNDQESDHVKHLIISKLALERCEDVLALKVTCGPSNITNIQVVKNVNDFLGKLRSEFEDFVGTTRKYGHDVVLRMDIENINETEISDIVARLDQIKATAKYRGPTFSVLQCQDAIALDQVYALKDACRSADMRFLILGSPDSANLEYYRERGVTICSDLRSCYDLSPDALKGDILLPIDIHLADLSKLAKLYYPDIYIIDLTNLRRIGLNKRTKKSPKDKIVLIFLDFCTARKTLEARLTPYVLILDNVSDRLEVYPGQYQDLIDSLNASIEAVLRIDY